MLLEQELVYKLDMRKVIDPDFAKIGEDYYLISKNEIEEFSAELVKVSAGEVKKDDGTWDLMYFCISNHQVIYIGREPNYSVSWFLVGKSDFEDLTDSTRQCRTQSSLEKKK